jgi:hypothetical protein
MPVSALNMSRFIDPHDVHDASVSMKLITYHFCDKLLT